MRDGEFCDFVSLPEVLGVAGGADPAERAEAQLKDVAHDVFDVGRVAEAVVGCLLRLRFYLRSCFCSHVEEAVAVIPELHASGAQLVDGLHLPPEGSMHCILKLFGVVEHHMVGFFYGEPSRIVAARVRIVQRGLV